jgi:hypothetical protein
MRKRTISILSIGLIFLLATPTTWAASTPPIQGGVFGVELCPQFICGAAYFSGTFVGKLGNNFNSVGSINAALIHDELPAPDSCSGINGGLWEIKTLFKRVRGVVQDDPVNEICNNGDGTFHIHAILIPTTTGFTGTVEFNGTLNHNTLIPTFWGDLE